MTTIIGFILMVFFAMAGAVAGYYYAKRQDAQAFAQLEQLYKALEGRESHNYQWEQDLSMQFEDVDRQRRRFDGIAEDVKKVEALRRLASRYDEWRQKLGDPRDEKNEIGKKITEAIKATGFTFEEFIEAVKPVLDNGSTVSAQEFSTAAPQAHGVRRKRT